MDEQGDGAEEMGGAEQHGDVVERRDALLGDRGFVFIVGLADVEQKRLGEADARVGIRPRNALDKTA